MFERLSERSLGFFFILRIKWWYHVFTIDKTLYIM